MDDDKKLATRQLLTIGYLISSSSIEEASQLAKVSRPTIYKWLKNDYFVEELKRQRDEVVRSALNRLKSATTKAAEELIKLMNAQKEEIRRLACNDVISYVLKNIEIEDIEERLDRIEKSMLGRKR